MNIALTITDIMPKFESRKESKNSKKFRERKRLKGE
jgi:hypothetical protein